MRRRRSVSAVARQQDDLAAADDRERIAPAGHGVDQAVYPHGSRPGLSEEGLPGQRLALDGPGALRPDIGARPAASQRGICGSLQEGRPPAAPPRSSASGGPMDVVPETSRTIDPAPPRVHASHASRESAPIANASGGLAGDPNVARG